MKINSIDHLVIYVHDPDETIAFHSRVLGMNAVTFANKRRNLVLGAQKINLHKFGERIYPQAQSPKPGSADLCFVTETPMSQVVAHLISCVVSTH